MSDKPDHLAADKDDSKTIKDHKALENQSSVSPEDYPDLKDRGLHIPKDKK
ncbi:hypothetical protein [Croceibacterium mercuriale]|uniref:hypothetical protein n=1 Tax=Croceibacterium mercuriale TaxID=1572751 RepID=UPI000A9ABD5C|nr:hypothetical protein [Croceibacterium mercuriale]